MDVDQVYDLLKIKERKLTKTRKAMIGMFFTNHTLLSAPEIIKLLKKQNINVNKTTVYRELAFLLDYGIIKEIILKSNMTFYEQAFLPHHHHMVCSSCGATDEFKSDELAETLKKIEAGIEKKGFKVSEHSLEFYGLCTKCHS
ncbi:transcriptional repressor [Candidatus Woesebacteria bacterium]|nr:MAG: transcriptional repressor [Candidatus Woesebacteria bacterium]